MRLNILKTVSGRLAVSILMLLALVLSPVSTSHAGMHNQGGSNVAVESNSTMDHAGGSHSHHKNQSDQAESEGTLAADSSHDSAETCCSAVCASAMIVSDFFSDKPVFSNSVFDWRTEPLIAGELTALHRPPNA